MNRGSILEGSQPGDVVKWFNTEVCKTLFTGSDPVVASTELSTIDPLGDQRASLVGIAALT